MNGKHQVKIILMVFIMLMIIGTIGYSGLLNVSILDSLYMTFMSIFGYPEMKNMNPVAKVFSMLILTLGVGIGGYTVGIIIDIIIEGKIRDSWRHKIMEKKMAKLQDHYILCGVGEIGEVIVDEFKQHKLDFIVIERNENKYEELVEEGVFVILGDATEEKVLEEAQIERAKGFISCLSKDADNIVTVLTARQMNADLYIVSRAISPNAPSKLKRAGANHIISPNEIGGRRMAAQIMKPSIVSFLDVITRIEDIELDLEGIMIYKNGQLVGKRITDIRIPEKTGLIILGIQKHDSEDILFNPKSDEILEEGDALLVLASTLQVQRLREMAGEPMEN